MNIPGKNIPIWNAVREYIALPRLGWGDQKGVAYNHGITPQQLGDALKRAGFKSNIRVKNGAQKT